MIRGILYIPFLIFRLLMLLVRGLFWLASWVFDIVSLFRLGEWAEEVTDRLDSFIAGCTQRMNRGTHR
ncbi:MAG: hypothetical protein LC731_07855 [Acidobacteria bacterium]|nr:hypothetical protein [Acidobacteriota bacterium]